MKKPNKRSNKSWISIGLLALLVAMIFYSWDFQKSFKQRQEITRYLVDTTRTTTMTLQRTPTQQQQQQQPMTSSLRQAKKVHSGDSSSSKKTVNSDDSKKETTTTTITSAPTLRPTNVQEVIDDDPPEETKPSSPSQDNKDHQKQQQEQDEVASSDDEDSDEDTNNNNNNDNSSSSSSLPPPLPPPLNLIPNHQLREHDYFSDSWIITKEKFLNLERRRLGIVEDACFVAIGSGGNVYKTSKMFVDWTDFMVEHMSKWWNELQILRDSDSNMFDLTLQYLDRYVQQVFQRNKHHHQPTTFQETIAVVAFAPYKSRIADRGHVLTFHSLAATLVSLYQVGFGRVVIAGYGEQDQTHVEAALSFLLSKATATISTTATTSKTQIKIGHTEFGFAKVVEQDWISTKWVKFNMPRGAVIGLQEALLGNITNGGDNETAAAVTSNSAWLGTTHKASYWKYVYLTEPDTILHTKLELLPSIKKGLDEGLSFFPHRLQPIPHGSDLPSAGNNNNNSNVTKNVSPAHAGRYVPNHVLPFSNVTMLDPTSTKNHRKTTTDMDAKETEEGITAYHCCDAGPSLKHENCGTWWWTCGFHDSFVQATLSQEDALEKHKRLANYPMMRLKHGTGVVFGPTEHGRKCIPSKDPCPKSSSISV